MLYLQVKRSLIKEKLIDLLTGKHLGLSTDAHTYTDWLSNQLSEGQTDQ